MANAEPINIQLDPVHTLDITVKALLNYWESLDGEYEVDK